MLEQLLNALPEEVRIWVKERKPKTSAEAGQLADDYAQARRQSAAVQGGLQYVLQSFVWIVSDHTIHRTYTHTLMCTL